MLYTFRGKLYNMCIISQPSRSVSKKKSNKKHSVLNLLVSDSFQELQVAFFPLNFDR